MEIRPEPRLRDTLLRLVRRSPRYARLTRRLLADSRISALDKAPLAGAIGYTISPIDLVPGIVPVLGQLDDMIVLLAALKLTLDRVPQDVANEHLMALGLLKADVDDDLRDCRRAATRVVTGSARGAAKAMRAGARVSMRIAGAGMRTVRNR
jgi:uncharacterized membrane protein YkvA (DUF1232 family)